MKASISTSIVSLCGVIVVTSLLAYNVHGADTESTTAAAGSNFLISYPGGNPDVVAACFPDANPSESNAPCEIYQSTWAKCLGTTNAAANFSDSQSCFCNNGDRAFWPNYEKCVDCIRIAITNGSTSPSNTLLTSALPDSSDIASQSSALCSAIHTGGIPGSSLVIAHTDVVVVTNGASTSVALVTLSSNASTGMITPTTTMMSKSGSGSSETSSAKASSTSERGGNAAGRVEVERLGLGACLLSLLLAICFF